MTSPAQRPRRWRRLGLRREVLILVPASFFLVILLSVFTLLSYRNALSLLAEEERSEAAALARRLTGEVASHPDPAARLRELAPAVEGAALLTADGEVLARTGTLPDGPLLAPLGQEPEPAARVLGPGEGLDGTVAAFVPIGRREEGAGAARWLRVDLSAATLAAQERGLAVLTWVVVGADAALALLVLLFLGHMLAPYETLLERARSAGASPEDAEDEVTFLLGTFERALEGLSGRTGGPGDDIAALQRTLGVSLESGVLLLDRAGNVLALNETGAELLGVERPEPGTSAERFLAEHPGLEAPADLIREAIAASREVRREECRIFVQAQTEAEKDAETGDGEPVERTLGLTVHPLLRDDRRDEDGDGGAAHGFLVLFVDLTEVRRRREQAQLAESLRQLGELAAGVAHELRNSLATVKGYLSLIDREARDAPEGLPGGVGDSLGEIRREADHLQRVLEDFLSFARPGSVRPEAVDLALVAERAAADPALGAEGSSPVRIERPPTGERTTVSGDPQLLERALRNLLRNAVEAGREAGDERVDLAVRGTPQGVTVTVADRGAGIAPELRERLFEPFATGRPDGVGLGLSLTHRIVTLHGGALSVEDRPSGGTLIQATFRASPESAP